MLPPEYPSRNRIAIPGRTTRKPPLLVRPRRILRCLVLDPVFPAVVRGARLARLCVEPARPRHQRRHRVAVRRGSRRLSSRTSSTSRDNCRRRRCSSAIRWARPSSSGCWPRARCAPPHWWRRCRLPDCSRSRRGWPPGIPDYVPHLAQFDPSRLSDSLLATLRPFYFSPDVPRGILIEAERHLNVESPRALLDLSLRLHMALPERPGVAGFRAGRPGDRICTPGDARATAHHHDVVATILPGMAHMLMLEPEWERRPKRSPNGLRGPNEAERIDAAATTLPQRCETPTGAVSRIPRSRTPPAACSSRNPGSCRNLACPGIPTARACPRLRRRPSIPDRAPGR